MVHEATLNGSDIFMILIAAWLLGMITILLLRRRDITAERRQIERVRSNHQRIIDSQDNARHR